MNDPFKELEVAGWRERGRGDAYDAAAGAITVALAAASARVITRRPGHARLARLPEQTLPAPRPERLAA